MVELKKLDWTKCKLPNIAKDCNAMFANAIGDEVQVCITDVMDGHCDVLATRNPWGGDWFTGPHIDERCIESLVNIHEATKVVDAFIAAETARIEAEEEAVNWIMVHWRDVEWLIEQKAKVRNYSSDGERWTDMCSAPKSYSHQYYHADRRTFPTGYDPEKPRWVEVHKSDARRLSDAGARVQRKMSFFADEWRDMTSTERGIPRDYRIDIHTLPPGVPLREKPKPVPEKKSRVVAEMVIKGPMVFDVSSNCFDSIKGKNPRIALIVDEES